MHYYSKRALKLIVLFRVTISFVRSKLFINQLGHLSDVCVVAEVVVPNVQVLLAL